MTISTPVSQCETARPGASCGRSWLGGPGCAPHSVFVLLAQWVGRRIGLKWPRRFETKSTESVGGFETVHGGTATLRRPNLHQTIAFSFLLTAHFDPFISSSTNRPTLPTCTLPVSAQWYPFVLFGIFLLLAVWLQDARIVAEATSQDS